MEHMNSSKEKVALPTIYQDLKITLDGVAEMDRHVASRADVSTEPLEGQVSYGLPSVVLARIDRRSGELLNSIAAYNDNDDISLFIERANINGRRYSRDYIVSRDGSVCVDVPGEDNPVQVSDIEIEELSTIVRESRFSSYTPSSS